MRIVVTGGAGFIGSNLIIKLIERFPEMEIMNLDKLTYASDLKYLESVKDNNRYRFKKVDLIDRVSVKEIIKKFQPHGVFHLAAESHVDNSIKGPEDFIQSNIVGSFNLLEECRQLWDSEDFDNEGISPRFIHVSTDEVYGSLGDDGAFVENHPFRPNSPYSASKAASDLIVRSYSKTFGMNVITTHCSNNYGPHQHDEKLIPTIIRTALANKPIPVYGNGLNVRDWLFVDDHCEALIALFEKGKAGETYNIGGNNEWSNIDLVNEICSLLDDLKPSENQASYKELISFVEDRKGHDFRYAIDASKLKNEIGWQASNDFQAMLKETVQYYLNRFSIGK